MMRAFFGVLALLIVVAVVGLLARKQLGTVAPVAAPAAAGAPAGRLAAPAQQVQQFQQSVQGVMQQARPMPEEK